MLGVERVVGCYSRPDVFTQAFLVEPWLGSVEVAYVEEAAYRGILVAAVAFHYEYVAVGIDANCDSVAQGGGGGIRPPVHRIDAHRARLGHYRLDVAYVGHGVVADCHPCVVSALSRFDIGCGRNIAGCHLIA